jgi:hypothetical protein
MALRGKIVFKYPQSAPLHRLKYSYIKDGEEVSVDYPLTATRTIEVETTFESVLKLAKDVPRDNLLLEFLFTEGKGNILYDSSGNGFHATIRGDYSWERLPTGKYVLVCNGVNVDAVIKTHDKLNLTTSGFTVVAWVLLYDIAGRRTILANRNASNYLVMADTGYPQLWLEGGVVKVISPTTIETNKWYQLAFVHDNTGYMGYIYVNGELWREYSIGREVAYNNGAYRLYLFSNYGSNYLHGLAGLVRLYGEPLPQSEIASMFEVERSLFGV